MTKRVQVRRSTGDVGPSVVPKYWNYRAFERREYGDGLVMQLEGSPSTTEDPQVIATVWIAADGLRGGWHRRVVDSPSDIGALYMGFRRGLAAVGLYPLWDDDGYRRTVTPRPAITRADANRRLDALCRQRHYDDERWVPAWRAEEVARAAFRRGFDAHAGTQAKAAA